MAGPRSAYLRYSYSSLPEEGATNQPGTSRLVLAIWLLACYHGYWAGQFLGTPRPILTHKIYIMHLEFRKIFFRKMLARPLISSVFSWLSLPPSRVFGPLYYLLAAYYILYSIQLP